MKITYKIQKIILETREISDEADANSFEEWSKGDLISEEEIEINPLEIVSNT